MTPEIPPTPNHDPQPRDGNDRFGPESAACVERSLRRLEDPDAALRLLRAVRDNGAAFAAYLILPDTNLAAETITDTFHDTYVDAWETFAEFRRDVLDGLGWLDAVQQVIETQGIPDDHLVWNYVVIDQRIRDIYDLVRLDGWWHVFYK